MTEDLASALGAVLPGPGVARKRFIAAVIEEVEVFHELTSPLVCNLRAAPEQLDRLESASKEFVLALRAMSDDVMGLMEQDLSVAARRRGVEPATAVARANATMSIFRETGSVAAEIAKAASTRRSRMKAKRTVGADAAFKSLIRGMMMRHLEAYGHRPSASHGGYFARALSLVLNHKSLPIKINGKAASLPSEESLKKLIDELGDAPAPKRGRKPLH